MLTREKIAPSVWVIYGSEQPDAAKAFVRFQEYYENASLKGQKGIVVRDIENWWNLHRDPDDSEPYYTAWSGFNISGKIILDLLRTPEFKGGFSLLEFLSNPTRFPRWHKQETEFLKLLEDLSVDEINSSYFIGMWNKCTTVLEHEVAHAFFATIPAYKAEQMLNISQFPKDLYKELTTQLAGMGYHGDVILDEAQAYLSSYIDTLPETFSTDKYNDYAHPFVETLQRYRKQFTPS